ncbi:hypothetical protein KR093_004497 [Drosophila rubida]|uniref:Uncharacterized protein n=1 Tax=Drosophila rubida TaxID=30044 RepID=A0AAD4JT32_9MUSC|nr:hypothetical protein KR093_004497 [Drosophila rubida]
MLRARIYVLLLLLSLSQGEIQQTPKTQLRPAYERVFSRRKRAIIFPPGSFIKFTCNFSKGLLSKYPRGINFNMEEAVYFPIPGTRDDLYPKRFLPKTTPKPKTTPQQTIVYIPGTDWRFKAVALPKKKPLKTHRIDEGGSSNPYKWQQWAQYGANQADKWKTTASKQWTNKSRWSKWTTAAPRWTADWTKQWPAKSSRLQVERTDNRYYHGHRDRRQLFDHFSGLSSLFGFDVKSCILRTICDAKRLLLPPGYSMLQDMLRLVFTMPRLDGLDDDYTHIMSKDADQCAKELKTKCNMSLLIWLLSGRHK